MGAPAAVEGDGDQVAQEDYHADCKGRQNLQHAHSAQASTLHAYILSVLFQAARTRAAQNRDNIELQQACAALSDYSRAVGCHNVER